MGIGELRVRHERDRDFDDEDFDGEDFDREDLDDEDSDRRGPFDGDGPFDQRDDDEGRPGNAACAGGSRSANA